MEPVQDQPEEEIKDQIAAYHDDIEKIHLEGYEIGVRKARNALFIAAALILVGELIGIARIPDGYEIDPISYLYIGGMVSIFIALALWTKKKPYSAIVLGIIAFIAYIILVAVVNGYLSGGEGVVKAIIGGWIFKVFILVALIRPLSDAKQLQKAKEEKRL